MSARETLRLFGAILRKEFIILLRYPINTIGGVVALYAFFLVVFLGGRAIGGTAFDESVGAIVVGYFLVIVSITGYNGLANDFTREASWGTLEQLYMSPVGFGRVTVLMALTKVVFSLGWGLAILALMLLTTGESLTVDLLSVLPIAAFAVLSVLGLGLVFGGAAVRFKRIGNLFNLVQFAFFGLVAAPVERLPALQWLPLAQGSHLLQRVMEDGVRLWELPPGELGVLVAVGVGYFLAGYAVFGVTTRWAREAGVMGHY